MHRLRTSVWLSLALGLPALAAPWALPMAWAQETGGRFLVLSRETFEGARMAPRKAVSWNDRLGRELVVAEVDASQLADLGRYVHESESRCGGFFAFGSRAEAEAFIAADLTQEAIRRPMGGIYTIDNHETVDAWLPQVLEANIRGTIGSLSGFRSRYYESTYGRQAAEWIRDTWQSLATGRSDVDVELTAPCASCSTQPSVILTVHGVELPDQVVVVGGHLDSVNWDTPYVVNQVAPGADDDASGIATITEIIRIAMANGWQPKRTVKFMGYAAEEVGLLGSAAIAARFKSDGTHVVGVLQLDMTNYKNGALYDMQIVDDNSNVDLLAYFRSLFDEYLAPLGLVRTSLSCGYGCSDHASWTSQGFPAGMVFEAGRPRISGLGGFPYIHTANDTIANMANSAANSVKFAQFGLAFVGELAKTHDNGTPVNQAPVANFTYTSDRMTVHFVDTSTDGDGAIVSHHWDFGDGNSSSLAAPDKTYQVVGTHTVTLTVVDDGGLPGTTTAPVTVDNGVEPLANGTPAAGLAAQAGTDQRFSIELPPGARNLRFSLTAAGAGADLSVAFGGQTVCESTEPAADRICAIANPPSAGVYAAAVHARTALAGFTITASFVSPGDGIFDDGFDP